MFVLLYLCGPLIKRSTTTTATTAIESLRKMSEYSFSQQKIWNQTREAHEN